MIASLGMYDHPETRRANDDLWALVRDRLRAKGHNAPEALTRGRPFWSVWTSPELLLAQTCGLPFRTRLHRHVTLVGTPDYGIAGCPPGHYRSALLVRADDPRQSLRDFDGARLAYNDAESQSGWAAFQAEAKVAGICAGTCLHTLSHQGSAAAVSEGSADIAALDVVSWAMIRRADPPAQNLRVLGFTPATPGLPLISARGRNRATLFAAVASAIRALPRETADILHLHGIVRIPASAYLALPVPPKPTPVGP